MSKIKRLLPIIVIVLLSQPIWSQSGQKEKQSLPENVLERKVPGYSVEYLTTIKAFGQSLLLTNTAGGIASSDPNCRQEKITQTWMPLGASLKDILNLIVTYDPAYRWSIEDNVINLLPKDGEPALLKTRINSFRLDSPTTIDSAVEQLMKLPEVQKQEKELGTSTGLKLIVGLRSAKNPKIILDYRDMTLREVLNAIVRAYGWAVWSYRERQCEGRNQYLIDFIVR
jgi:hypothetical protein